MYRSCFRIRICYQVIAVSLMALAEDITLRVYASQIIRTGIRSLCLDNNDSWKSEVTKHGISYTCDCVSDIFFNELPNILYRCDSNADGKYILSNVEELIECGIQFAKFRSDIQSTYLRPSTISTDGLTLVRIICGAAYILSHELDSKNVAELRGDDATLVEILVENPKKHLVSKWLEELGRETIQTHDTHCKRIDLEFMITARRKFIQSCLPLHAKCLLQASEIPVRYRVTWPRAMIHAAPALLLTRDPDLIWGEIDGGCLTCHRIIDENNDALYLKCCFSRSCKCCPNVPSEFEDGTNYVSCKNRSAKCYGKLWPLADVEGKTNQSEIKQSRKEQIGSGDPEDSTEKNEKMQ